MESVAQRTGMRAVNSLDFKLHNFFQIVLMTLVLCDFESQHQLSGIILTKVDKKGFCVFASFDESL